MYVHTYVHILMFCAYLHTYVHILMSSTCAHVSIYPCYTQEARTEREEGAVSLINTSPFTVTVPATYIHLHIHMHIHMYIYSRPIHIPMYLEIFHLHLNLHFFATHRRLARRGRHTEGLHGEGGRSDQSK